MIQNMIQYKIEENRKIVHDMFYKLTMIFTACQSLFFTSILFSVLQFNLYFYYPVLFKIIKFISNVTKLC